MPNKDLTRIQVELAVQRTNRLGVLATLVFLLSLVFMVHSCEVQRNKNVSDALVACVEAGHSPADCRLAFKGATR